jgi:hypothetical protein
MMFHLAEFRSLAPLARSPAFLFLQVLYRISTHANLKITESSTAPPTIVAQGEAMTQEQHSQALYDNWLFDAAKIFDVCSLYAKVDE